MEGYKKCGIVAVICLIVISIVVIFINRDNIFKKEKHNWLIKEVVVNRDDYYETRDLMEVIPRWEELTITQQFSSIESSGRRHDARNKEMPEEMVGEKIENVVIKGYDTYTENTYTHKAELYKVKDFPEECVVAVQYEGTDEYYGAINTYYKPATLGNFIEDLNLKQIVSFGTVNYEYCDTDKYGNKKYENIEFPNVDNNIIWEMLFDGVTAENVYEDGVYHNTIMGISVNIPLLGYENIGVSLSEDGYLTTNILETGKRFYLGEEKVQKFVKYIIENYDGYKTVYVDENGNELSWDEQEDEKVGDDTIMVYNNEINETKEYILSNPNSSMQNFAEPYDPIK